MIILREQTRRIECDDDIRSKNFYVHRIMRFARQRGNSVQVSDDGFIKIKTPSKGLFSADTGIALSIIEENSVLEFNYLVFTSGNSLAQYIGRCLTAGLISLAGLSMQAELIEALGFKQGLLVTLVFALLGFALFYSSMDWISKHAMGMDSAFWQSVDEEKYSQILFDKRQELKFLLIGFMVTLLTIALLYLISHPDTSSIISGVLTGSGLFVSIFLIFVLVEALLIAYMGLKRPTQPILSKALILGGSACQFTIIAVCLFHIQLGMAIESMKSVSEFLMLIVIMIVTAYAVSIMFVWLSSRGGAAIPGASWTGRFVVSTPTKTKTRDDQAETSLETKSRYRKALYLEQGRLSLLLVMLWFISSALTFSFIFQMEVSSMKILSMFSKLEYDLGIPGDPTLLTTFLVLLLLVLLHAPLFAYLWCMIMSIIAARKRRKQLINGILLNNQYEDGSAKAKTLLLFARQAAMKLKIKAPKIILGKSNSGKETPEAAMINAISKEGIITIPLSWYRDLTGDDLSVIIAHEIHHLRCDTRLLMFSLILSMLTLFGRNFLATVMDFSQREYLADQTSARLTSPQKAIATLRKLREMDLVLSFVPGLPGFVGHKNIVDSNAPGSRWKRFYEIYFGQYIPAQLYPSFEERIQNIKQEFGIS